MYFTFAGSGCEFIHTVNHNTVHILLNSYVGLSNFYIFCFTYQYEYRHAINLFRTSAGGCTSRFVFLRKSMFTKNDLETIKTSRYMFRWKSMFTKNDFETTKA